MNKIHILLSVKLSIGLIAAAVSFPFSATAATLYVSDSNTIKKISSTGTVTTFATGISSPLGLAFDGSGNLFAADFAAKTIKQISSTGIVTTFATGLTGPAFLAFRPDPVSTAVPEPFTIIGTLVGGTAALRMRKKLKANAS